MAFDEPGYHIGRDRAALSSHQLAAGVENNERGRSDQTLTGQALKIRGHGLRFPDEVLEWQVVILYESLRAVLVFDAIDTQSQNLGTFIVLVKKCIAGRFFIADVTVMAPDHNDRPLFPGQIVVNAARLPCKVSKSIWVVGVGIGRPEQGGGDDD